jgi:hypothetical protein
MANEINDMADLEKLISGQTPAQPELTASELALNEPAPVAAVEEAALNLTPAEDDVVTAEVQAESETTEADDRTIAAEKVKVETPEDIRTRQMEALLSGLSVDLTSVNIVKSSNPLGTFQEIETLYTRPSYDVIALQSGYRVAFKPLNNNDMIRVRKFGGTEREQNLKLFTFVFSMMVNSSLGKISFEDWLKVTSEADFETLIYGIYCATFPDEGDYNVTCPHCNKENKTKIGKEHLIQVKDVKATGSYINDLLNKNYAPNELVKHSVVNMTKRLITPKRKTIVELTTPTLADYLRSLQRAEQHRGIEPELFGYLKHISKIMIPHLQSFAEGKPSFIELETVEDKIRVIVEMPKEDKQALDKEINEKMNQYKVDYKLPGINCGGCGQAITNINVDLTDVLFQNIARV